MEGGGGVALPVAEVVRVPGVVALPAAGAVRGSGLVALPITDAIGMAGAVACLSPPVMPVVASDVILYQVFVRAL